VATTEVSLDQGFMISARSRVRNGCWSIGPNQPNGRANGRDDHAEQIKAPFVGGEILDHNRNPIRIPQQRDQRPKAMLEPRDRRLCSGLHRAPLESPTTRLTPST